jgi:hypothetical protein
MGDHCICRRTHATLYLGYRAVLEEEDQYSETQRIEPLAQKQQE